MRLHGLFATRVFLFRTSFVFKISSLLLHICCAHISNRPYCHLSFRHFEEVLLRHVFFEIVVEFRIADVTVVVDIKTFLRTDRITQLGKDYAGLLTRDGEDHYSFVDELRKGLEGLVENK